MPRNYGKPNPPPWWIDLPYDQWPDSAKAFWGRAARAARQRLAAGDTYISPEALEAERNRTNPPGALNQSA